jgi:hypothetical protein
MKNSRHKSNITFTPNLSSITNVSLDKSFVNINQCVKAMPGMTIFKSGSKKVVLSRTSFMDEFKKEETKLPDIRNSSNFLYSQFISVKSRYSVS